MTIGANMSGAGTAERQKPKAWAWMLLALAAALMLWRGSWRALGAGESSDFSLVYQSTRAFNQGVSPYDPAAMEPLWPQAGGPVDQPQLYPNVRGPALFVYPPTTFVIFTPLAAMPWPVAKVVWMGLNTLLLVWSVKRLTAMAGMAGTLVGVLFSAYALAMAPGHTAIFVGQLSILAFALVVASASAQTRGQCVIAGVRLGLACAVKPQLGVPFLVYELVRMRWTVGITAVVTVAVLAGIAIARLEIAGVPWFEQFKANVALLTTSDNGDSSQHNVLAYQLMNIQAWLHTFTDDRGLVTKLAAGVLGLLVVAFASVDRFKSESGAELLSRSVVACVSILAVYHRMYDAVFLMLPVAWACSRRGGLAWTALVLSAVLLVPGASLLALNKARLPQAITESALWTRAILTHAVIAVILMTVALIAARRGERVSGRA